MHATRDSFGPAVLASLAFHALLLTGMLMVWPQLSKPMVLGVVVPVQLVADAPAPAPQPAPEAVPITDAPIESAEIAPVAPPNPPTDLTVIEPPLAKVAPRPHRTPTKPRGLDLDALADVIQSATRASPERSVASHKPDTATGLQGSGRGVSAAAMADLAAPLERLWNPNCEVEGGANVDLVVSAVIASSGYLVGDPKVLKGVTADPITQAAATRAISAMRRAQPFRVPSDFGQQAVTFRLNARNACAHTSH